MNNPVAVCPIQQNIIQRQKKLTSELWKTLNAHCLMKNLHSDRIPTTRIIKKGKTISNSRKWGRDL